MARILIVDDDPDMVLATRLCMEGAGHTVVAASSGSEGLAKVKAEHPDLIVLDVMMDTTTEGFQVALALRSAAPKSEYAAFRDVPIIILTAIHTTAPVRLGPDADYLPVEAFLDKPIDPEALVALTDKLLKQHAGAH